MGCMVMFNFKVNVKPLVLIMVRLALGERIMGWESYEVKEEEGNLILVLVQREHYIQS